MIPKILANYLPQYHAIPENSQWWGDGYTDWTAVRSAAPVISGQVQPRVPLDNKYRMLDDIESIKWQVSLAQQYGVYGFAIYHYWFSSSMQLLQTPAELIRDNQDIDIHYMFIWDNCSWKRTWSGVKGGNDWAPSFDSGPKNEHEESGVLAELVYGSEHDWEFHFNYLLTHFKDDRYIKVDGKPLFAFLKPRNDFQTICKMVKYWDLLAKKNGYPGVCCLTLDNCLNRLSSCELKNRFRYYPRSPQNIYELASEELNKRLNCNRNHPVVKDYDREWNRILKSAARAPKNTYLSGFVSFDDTPRRGNKATIYLGSSPDKFEKYFSKLLRISENRGDEYVFLSAWNEWGEGMYLEPDKLYEYGWLEAVSRARRSCSAL